MNEIKCIYCNEPWSEDMLEQYGFCEGSYTPWCVTSKFYKNIDINCSHCGKLVYRKELDELAEEYDNNRWGDNQID